MNSDFRVVCGICRCSPGLMLDEGREVVVCPCCGQADGVDEAYRIAGEHLNRGPESAGRTFRWQAVIA